MSGSTAICPGSFDPVTVGHLDIIRRASSMFDKVIVVVMNNTAKHPLFSADERVEMLKKTTSSLENVDIDSYDGLLAEYAKPQTSEASYEGNLAALGVADLASPSRISIYPVDFESKEALVDLINRYNREKADAGQEEAVINYTDYVGLMMSSVSTIINTISYVLIAFVAISLVVSSIMIGIITYISVLERTKEIGILRSIGASKRDISRVFNAETLTVGFVSGMLGILVTVLLCIPVNMLIKALANISNVAQLPWAGGVILVAISMLLTFIAGLIPSRIAARRDPVVALRTE